ncbi:MAG: hypothetical protein A2046_01235 [Bacteroidetes bacterium GWA2_30_7]|nr:MAG: hypothetical protein A2046_01235 [Bacteroidetes bacterium GWA2_30_7]
MVFFWLISLVVSKYSFSQSDILNVDTIFSQSDLDRFVSVDDYDAQLLQSLILKQLNKQLVFNNKEPLMLSKLLKYAAEDQAEYMSIRDETTIDQSGNKSTTQDRLIFYEGSGLGDEFVLKINANKGKEPFTYKQIADEIVFKWFNNNKSLDIVSNPSFILTGIAARLDETGRRIYVSIVLGNYKSYNSGAKRRDELNVPYSTKKYGLLAFDEKACKTCDKFKNLENLTDGLFVRDGIIIFKFDKIKDLKKLIRKPKDGLAIDIIQKEQYSCVGDNIIDNSLNNKGVMLKRVYSNKLYKKNLITDKKVKKLEVELGIMPDIKGDYELNLMIIQDKYVCRNLFKPFLLDAGLEYSTTVRLLADTATINAEEFIPVAETSSLSFKIPFEKNKFTYKQEDISPLLKSLNEPDFLIDKIKIAAFSSIEGGENENKILQEKRAQSIIDALKNIQKNNINKEIITSENWDDFKKDIAVTTNVKLATMSLDEAKEYIKSNNLQKELEPIFANHRYAQIDMDITYDILGQKEETYVISRFNKAVKNNNLPLALSIQKFIFKKVLSETYAKEAVYKQDIPNTQAFAGLLMNKLWLEMKIDNEELDETMCEKIIAIAQLDPFNSYLQYNKLFCHILHESVGDDNQIQEYQAKIMELYFSTLSKPTVDALNLEYQFKIIDALDTLDTPHPLLIESLNRVKEIVNLKDANWLNSLKLAYLFMKQKDFEFAAKLLEPFIDNEQVFEELIFTYISLCSHTPAKLSSNKFVRAMQKAQEINHERYCKLFDGKHLSFQVFENEIVKKDYCKSCK